ncbi:MAG: hypothetical protein HY520_04925 [Candidatus Aenigmarchaeota archaeon]|nr:hypothetical protein [Candidatus Aenigmarchaeota archaeon]
MKKLVIKPERLLPYWEKMRSAQTAFHRRLGAIEKEMQQKFGNTHLEFFWADGGIVGVGTYPHAKEMDLIHDSDLERAR